MMVCGVIILTLYTLYYRVGASNLTNWFWIYQYWVFLVTFSTLKWRLYTESLSTWSSPSVLLWRNSCMCLKSTKQDQKSLDAVEGKTHMTDKICLRQTPPVKTDLTCPYFWMSIHLNVLTFNCPFIEMSIYLNVHTLCLRQTLPVKTDFTCPYFWMSIHLNVLTFNCPFI